MGSVGAVVAGSVVGGLIQSNGAKSAASTQASAMDRAGERMAQAATEAKTEILDRMAPALSDYNKGISESIEQIKQGGQNVISVLNSTNQNAKNILSLKSFSQPYSESGFAGYAELSSQFGLSGSN